MKKPDYSRVYIEVTNVCNASCSFCPGTTRVAKFMEFDEFSAILDALDGLTEYIYFHVMGEPLLHPDLPRFISYATSRGFKCAVTTNGTLLADRADELLASGVYKLNISVHSFEDGTDERYFSYLDSVIDFADRASRSGVLTVLRLWNLGHDGGRNDRTVSALHARFSDPWVEGVRGARLRHRLHLEYGERFDWPDMDAPESDCGLFCYGLRDHFGILVDGSVIPCCLDHNGDMTLGNVHDAPLADILSSPRATAILTGFDNRTAVEQLCRKCGYARRFKL